MITEYILESQDHLETSLKLAQSLQLAKNQLKEKFDKQLEEIAEELAVRYDTNKRCFYPSCWTKHTIHLSYAGSAILYGIARNEPLNTKETLPEIQELINDNFKASEWWPMWKDFYSNINYNPDFWLDIHSGKAKARIKEFVEKINANFNTDKY
jgi:hypothetical protein